MKKIIISILALITLCGVVTSCTKDKNEPNSTNKQENEEGQNGNNQYNGYDYVDLGLPSGIKWANMNVGATTPEGYGDYFAWGETKPKQVYNPSSYKWSNGSDNTLTKYCIHSEFGYNGFTDGKTTLDPKDDAAYVNWGRKWRMPTKAEQDELQTECTWTWTTNYNDTGVKGYVVKSKKNSNLIFLPASKYHIMNELAFVDSGWYWSSSLYEGSSSHAYILYIGSDSIRSGIVSRDCLGLPVRAVCE